MKKQNTVKNGVVLKSPVPIYRSCRWRIAIVGMFGFMYVFVLRVNISVAIVCMATMPNISEPLDGYSERNSLSNRSATTIATTDDSSCISKSSDGPDYADRAEFVWSKSVQSSILASFFYGYIITQIPGGWLARRYGCRLVFGVGMTICAISTILLPVCARTHVYLVFVMRAIAGLATGVVFPAFHCLWGRWAPPNERSKLTAVTYAGISLGSILALTVSGVLCSYGFDNGWPSIFYIFGGTCLVYVVIWFYVAHDTPAKHPRITPEERDFIEKSIGDNYDDDKKRKTPWLAMMKSSAVWANITAHMCNNWTAYTLVTGLPMYMKEALKFDIKQNGALSSIPYIMQYISSIASATVADSLREKGILNTQITRRIFQTIAFLGIALFTILTGFVTCENRMAGVAYLSLGVWCMAMSRGGYVVNHVDYGPRFAGELFGITNTMATIPGMLAPIVNGALTPNMLQEEWQRVFFLCAAFALIGALVFGIFVKGELEPWAKPTGVEIEISLEAEKNEALLQSVEEKNDLKSGIN